MPLIMPDKPSNSKATVPLLRNCKREECPDLASLQLYARGLYALLDEEDFNLIEDCLFQDACEYCTRVVEGTKVKNRASIKDMK